MSWIGIGNTMWRRGGGSAAPETPDGNPSDLVLTVISDTEIDGTFTEGSTNQDGFRVYISTDNVTFTEKTTVTSGSFQATGLTAGILYYFYVVAYKGSQESTATDVENKTTSSEYGTIFLDEFDTLSSNWITTSIGLGGNLSVSDGKLTYTRTNYGDFNSQVYYDNSVLASILEQWDLEVVVVINLQDVYRAGLGFGFRSIVGNHVTRWVLLNINESTSVANKGKMSIWDYNATNYVDPQQLTISTGDRVRLRMNRNKNTFTCKSKNLTTDSAELTYVKTWSMDDSVQTLIPIVYPSIFNFGGTKTIEYFKWTTTAWKNASFGFLGDSITTGYEVTAIGNRFVDLIDAITSKTFTVFAAQSTFISEFTARCLTELGNFIPGKLIICMGSNEIIGSVAEGTIETNYSSMINSIVALGIIPIICKIPPVNGKDVRTFNTWLQTTYSGTYTIIDLYTPLVGVEPSWNAAYMATGGIHPNDAGHDLIYDTIVATIPSII